MIVICCNNIFHLFSWSQIPGSFNIIDVGNILIIIGLVVCIFRKNDLQILYNVLSVCFIVLLFLVACQIPLAMYHYNERLISGIIAVRFYGYYLSFFFFLLVLRTRRDIILLLHCMSAMAICIILLSVINYFGPVIFYHQWAEGHHFRSGIKRAFIPGMDIVSLAVLWQFCYWVEKSAGSRQGNLVSFFTFFLLLGAHYFRQTRSRIIAVVLVILTILGLRGRWRTVFAIVILSATVIGISGTETEEHLLVRPFSTAAEDMAGGEGTWSGRKVQIGFDLEEFKAHPLIGSGLIAIRNVRKIRDPVKRKDAILRGKMEDLGYTHWMKAFGISGIIWLVFFFVSLLLMAHRAVKLADDNDRVIALFGFSYIGYVIISFVTIPHLMFPRRILPLCLVAALIVRSIWNQRKPI
jgi:hypothetical protein